MAVAVATAIVMLVTGTRTSFALFAAPLVVALLPGVGSVRRGYQLLIGGTAAAALLVSGFLLTTHTFGFERSRTRLGTVAQAWNDASVSRTRRGATTRSWAWVRVTNSHT